MIRMLERHIPIVLDDNPRYAGSVHDDVVARRMGYRAALVPGAFLYGHFSRLAVDLWGMDWIAHGGIGITFRRAVYNGDTVRLTAQNVPNEAGQRLDLVMTGPGHEELATGWISLDRHPPPPPEVSESQIKPLPVPRPVYGAGQMSPGLTGGSAGAVLTRAEIAESLRAFGEDHPIYQGGLLAHSGCLMRKAMFEINQSFQLPGPYVLTACEGQHFAPMQAGERFTTISRVLSAFERKGRHYFESDEIVLGNARPVARFRRCQIYAGTT